MILTSLIGCAGVGLTMIENFYVLLLGRIILGFTSGSQGVIVVRMINEYVPAAYLSLCFGIFVASQNFGAAVALFSGLILPKETEEKQLEENETWRLIFGFPLVYYALILFGFLVVIQYDTPTFYVARGETS